MVTFGVEYSLVQRSGITGLATGQSAVLSKTHNMLKNFNFLIISNKFNSFIVVVNSCSRRNCCLYCSVRRSSGVSKRSLAGGVGHRSLSGGVGHRSLAGGVSHRSLSGGGVSGRGGVGDRVAVGRG
jgi:hypothetical protein